jgi:hypothetical protein
MGALSLRGKLIPTGQEKRKYGVEKAPYVR